MLEAEAAERARRSAATALGHQRAAACAAAFGPQQHAPVLAQPTSCAYGLATRILADDPPLPLAPFPAIASATGEDAPTDTPIPRHACTVLGAVPAGEVHVTLERHATPLPARGTLLFVRTRADTFEFLWRAAATGEVDDTLAVRRRCGTVRAARVPGGIVVALAAAAPAVSPLALAVVVACLGSFDAVRNADVSTLVHRCALPPAVANALYSALDFC